MWRTVSENPHHELFMRKALVEAQTALLAGEFPVGCVLVCEDRVVASGARKGTASHAPNETDHAEILALNRLSRRKPAIDTRRITAYCTLEPCLMCYGALLISGISHIVYAYEDAMGGGTRCDLDAMPPLYRKAAISLIPHVLRHESLLLFKAYFENPANGYLKNTFLAEYTLAQPSAIPAAVTPNT
ncbi:MAG: nucleoside deaminase [Desulfobacterales bacterium]|jgi:tRNA(adenine34) deaminase|nr:nucleoside deaminase [Desulfobacterales bacterium]